MLKFKKILSALPKLIKFCVPYVILLVIAYLFTSNIFFSMRNEGYGDWSIYCQMDEIARESILHHRQFPLWNPYSNGGRPMLGHPQSGFLRPTFFLPFIFGCTVGLKIELLLMMWIGLVGMFLVSRHYKTEFATGIFAASVFGLSSFFSLHVGGGHFVFSNYFLLPFVFLFFLKSFDQKRYLLFTGIVFAFIILGGGTGHALIPIFFFLVMFSAVYSFQRKDMLPILYLALIIIFSFVLSAVKVLPALDFIQENPRIIDASDKTTIKGLYHIFLNRNQNRNSQNFEDQHWGWPEYGAYTGIIPLILFAIGLFLLWKNQFPLMLSGFMTFFISLGDWGAWSPWHILHKLPFFMSIRVPSRFIILFVFCLAIISGLAVDWLLKKTQHSTRQILIYAIVIFVIVDLLLVNSTPFHASFTDKALTVEKNVDFRQVSYAAYGNVYRNFLSNAGTVDVDAGTPNIVSFAKPITDPSYKGEVYLELEGKASYDCWSPNKLIVNVETQVPNRVVINQNYDKGWRVRGGQAESFNGLLSANVTESDRKLEFYYLPRTFAIGGIISILSLVCMLFLIFHKIK